MPTMADGPEELARLLLDADHAIALTGAGISTESGIPDFRSPTGVWQRVDPMEVASMSTFMSDPARFWAFHRPRYDLLTGVEPNAAHRAMAELQRRGLIRALITQNIDRLHARAGSQDVIEVHGSMRHGECLRCGERIAIEALMARADAAEDGVPRCEPCGFQMKSAVIMFGEALPAAAITAAFDASDRADLILVVGSSLQVAPVSELPGVVRRRGGRIAILTEGDTPYDDVADLRLRGRAGEQLTEALAELDRLTAA
jgi:NAD-dependent deacetylase